MVPPHWASREGVFMRQWGQVPSVAPGMVGGTVGVPQAPAPGLALLNGVPCPSRPPHMGGTSWKSRHRKKLAVAMTRGAVSPSPEPTECIRYLTVCRVPGLSIQLVLRLPGALLVRVTSEGGGTGPGSPH